MSFSERNILGSQDLLDTMSEEDWKEVCDAMVCTALEQGEPEFIVDLIVALFRELSIGGVFKVFEFFQISKHSLP